MSSKYNQISINLNDNIHEMTKDGASLRVDLCTLPEGIRYSEELSESVKTVMHNQCCSAVPSCTNQPSGTFSSIESALEPCNWDCYRNSGLSSYSDVQARDHYFQSGIFEGKSCQCGSPSSNNWQLSEDHMMNVSARIFSGYHAIKSIQGP